MNKFFSKSWNLGFTVGDSLRASTSEDVKNMIYAEPSFFGNLEFLNIVSLGYKIGVFVQNASLLEDEVCPMFLNPSGTFSTKSVWLIKKPFVFSNP